MIESRYPTTLLSEIAEIFSGYAFKSKELTDEPNNAIPVIKIANIQDKKVLKECKGYLPTDLYLDKYQRYFLERDDFLIAMTGAGSVGKVGKMRGMQRQYLVNQRVALVRTDSAKADPEFIYQTLSQDVYEATLYSLGLGAGQPNVSAKDIGKLEIPFPSLEVQRKISAVLSAYDDLIENNTRRIAILEEMAQRLYREWFVRGQVPGTSQVPGTFDPRNGRVPEGWEIMEFGDVSLNFDSKRIPLSVEERATRQGKYPYYGASGIIDHLDDYIFDGEYLLISEDGANLVTRNTPIAFIAVGQFWVNNHAHIVQGKRPFPTEFLRLHISNSDISGFITGAAQPKLSQRNLNIIPVICPPEDLLTKFGSIVESLSAQKVILAKKNDNLRQTRDLLLPRLISGELDVSELEITL